MIGYDKIPSTIPTGPLPEPMLDRWFEREQAVRSIVIGAGVNEIVTYSLTSRARMLNLLAYPDNASAQALLQAPVGVASSVSIPASRIGSAVATFDPQLLPAVVLANPLSSDLECLRLTLLSGLLETVAENSKRNRAGIRFFEIGRRYLPARDPQALPDERRTVGIALCGPAEISWLPDLARPADFYDLKGVVETLLAALKITRYRFTPTQHPSFHPGRCALLELPRTTADGVEAYSPIGVVGEVHPLVQQRYDLPHRAYLAELDLERLYEAVPERITYQPISRHQELARDLAIVVDQQVLAQDIEETIVLHASDLLRSVTLFDVYTGDPIPSGKKNLTYSLIYQSATRTLNDTEANALQDQIIRALSEKFSAVLR
jgi:phenylalanyl-tRNA synthetase beta chain